MFPNKDEPFGFKPFSVGKQKDGTFINPMKPGFKTFSEFPLEKYGPSEFTTPFGVTISPLKYINYTMNCSRIDNGVILTNVARFFQSVDNNKLIDTPNEEYLDKATELFKFLTIRAVYGNKVSPSVEMDHLWHTVILETTLYQELCLYVFKNLPKSKIIDENYTKGIIDHSFISSFESDTEKDMRYETCLSVYKSIYKIVTQDTLWPENRTMFHEEKSCIDVYVKVHGPAESEEPLKLTINTDKNIVYLMRLVADRRRWKIGRSDVIKLNYDALDYEHLISETPITNGCTLIYNRIMTGC